MTSVKRLILASRSPRRRELLTRLGMSFEVATADVDETARDGEAPAALVQRLARAKALAVAARYPGQSVLAADTIIVLDDEVLGKPTDEVEAAAMLRRLRGRPHQVLSAVFVLNPATGRQATELSESVIWMRDYSDAEIAAYVASGDPLDKAGAYAIQNRDFAPAARIEGCFTSVMGFPLGHVARALAAVGIAVPGDVVAACHAYVERCCQESGRP